MKKIPTCLVRDPDHRAHVLEQIAPGCEWVFGDQLWENVTATRKYDGTCVMLDGAGIWWARREVRPGRPTPPDFRLVQFDPTTGKAFGWVPIGDSPFFRCWHEAVNDPETPLFLTGTYELYGPKINGNPEHVDRHQLIRHVDAQIIGGLHPETPHDLAQMIPDLRRRGYEGVVFHHDDGRMAKIKVRDFPSA